MNLLAISSSLPSPLSAKIIDFTDITTGRVGLGRVKANLQSTNDEFSQGRT